MVVAHRRHLGGRCEPVAVLGWLVAHVGLVAGGSGVQPRSFDSTGCGIPHLAAERSFGAGGFRRQLVGSLLGGGGRVLLLLGELGTVYVLVQYAFVITLFGLTLAFLGTAAFRLIAIPMLILFLMIPLPQFVIANPFGQSSAPVLASGRLVHPAVRHQRLFGRQCHRSRRIQIAGGRSLQRTPNYLFPLMTMGFLMAYFYKGALWKRVALFFSSIPIAVIMNSLRIGTIGVMVEHWGIAMAEGFLHEFQGWAVFMASAAC
jgi:exosortase